MTCGVSSQFSGWPRSSRAFLFGCRLGSYRPYRRRLVSFFVRQLASRRPGIGSARRRDQARGWGVRRGYPGLPSASASLLDSCNV
ncbi:hypothetical protein AAHA92_12668 [Salvia divinorum]|uniref:Uncharacterized protein n=1 Tax=Salvia divinorum TaxID=28513 RepID=A0ABD1HM08_SALDI